MAAKNYIASLDGLRAFAVGMVILNHVSNRVAPGGNIGVDVFFVLSGFLITSVMLREVNSSGRVKLGRFYLRRTLRLAPALLFLALCNGIFIYFFGTPAGSELMSFLSALSYTMDFARAFQLVPQGTVMGHTWSLAIEEQFYLLWPAALFLLLKLKARHHLSIVAALIVLVNLWRIYLFATGASHDRIYYPLDTRADELLIGCWVSLWLNSKPDEKLVSSIAMFWPLAAMGILAMIRWDFLEGSAFQGVEFGIVGILSAVIILQASTGESKPLKAILSFSPLVWIGQISYGIYLWHYPILLQTRFRTDNKYAVIICVGLSILAAAFSYWFVEKPFLRLKSKFESPEVGASPDAAEPAPSPPPQQSAARSVRRPGSAAHSQASDLGHWG